MKPAQNRKRLDADVMAGPTVVRKVRLCDEPARRSRRRCREQARTG